MTLVPQFFGLASRLNVRGVRRRAPVFGQAGFSITASRTGLLVSPAHVIGDSIYRR